MNSLKDLEELNRQKEYVDAMNKYIHYLILVLFIIGVLIAGITDMNENNAIENQKDLARYQLFNNGIHKTDNGTWVLKNVTGDSRGNEYVFWYECSKCKQTTYKIRDIAYENTYGELK